MVYVLALFGEFMHNNLFLLNDTFQILVRFNEPKRETGSLLLKDLIEAGFLHRTVEIVCLHVVLIARWQHIIENLDGVPRILLVDNRILNI